MSIFPMPCAIKVFLATVEAFAVHARIDLPAGSVQCTEQVWGDITDGDQRCPELRRM
jgi:hypothetical protein